MANRLSRESSPYLLQHQNNPVDWYPWGEEAFAKAENEDKPVFLSIGYSTCHWCHVMEHESFEDDEVAALLNDSFVSIKVDREERPDVDNVYMSVCQLVGGQCGWPLNVVLTPTREPFFVGTYFPKTGRGGRIGMMELLPKLATAWASDRDRVLSSAGNITEAVSKLSTVEKGTINPDWSTIALSQFTKSFDRHGGGFGSRPKFPSPHNLMFLLRAARSGDDATLDMITTSLDRMATGGFHDHVGGGFHRYSTDSEWRLPHFEKMLYDQAMLIMAYTEAWQATGNVRFRETAYRAIGYVRRDLASASGSFYSAEDADSEGEEGKFYVWSREEFGDIVKSIDVANKFDIRQSGNFEDEAKRVYTGDNVLHMTNPAESFDRSDSFYSKADLVALDELLRVRAERIRPGLDYKIMTDWNGLMIAALAKAGAAFADDDLIRAAEATAANCLEPFDRSGSLDHVLESSGESTRFLDDYAFLLFGLIELYRSTLDPKWLRYAIRIGESTIDRFADLESGALFLVPDSAEDLIVRPLDFNDGALPSGNAISAYSFAQLYRLTGDSMWFEKAEAIINAAASNISRYPSAFAGMLMAADNLRSPGREIVGVGRREDNMVVAAQRHTYKEFNPYDVMHLLGTDTATHTAELKTLVDYLSVFDENAEPAQIFICNNFACQLPITEVDMLSAALADPK